MPWVILLLSAVFEAIWATALGRSDGLSDPVASVVFLVTLAISMAGLGLAVRSIPIGTAYAIWTGIGAMGVAVLGIYLFNDSASPARLACVGLIVAGVIGL